mgnify:CR=1 FL=1
MDNRFGTTSGMVIQTVMENGQEFCLAIDERGLYLTSANYLDKNLADPHRYSGSRATTPVWVMIPLKSMMRYIFPRRMGSADSFSRPGISWARK